MRRAPFAAFAGLLAVCAAGGPACATVEENEVAARLTSEATLLLDQLLGPGRAKVMVTVQGERSETRSETEILVPVKPRGQDNKPVPGYGADLPDAKATYFQKDRSQSVRLSGLTIRSIRVSVVLDTSVTDDQVAAVKRILPDLLRLDIERGDAVTVLRARLLPVWRQALMTPDGMKTAAWLGAGALVVLWLSVVVYFTAIRVVRVFMAEAAALRPQQAAPPTLVQTAPSPESPLTGPEEPEVLGGPGGYGVEPGGDAQAALGQRFDFLASAPPLETAELLAKQTAEDLAVLFGHLAETQPQVSARLFAALPPVLQADLTRELVAMTMSDPERLAIVESNLRTAVEFRLSGTQRMARILSQLLPEEREEALAAVRAGDPGKAAEVERQLFSFEDLAGLRPGDLRRLIMTLSFPDWGAALRGAPKELVELILGQIPTGPKELVQDAMKESQPRERVVEARNKVLSQAYAMEAKGQIHLKAAAAELI